VVPDQVRDRGTGVLEVHHQVTGGLGDAVRGGVGGGAEDAESTSLMGSSRMKANRLDAAREGSRSSTIHQPDTPTRRSPADHENLHVTRMNEVLGTRNIHQMTYGPARSAA
jgi:hypothetical protein